MMFTVGRIQLIRKFIALITVVNQESLSLLKTLSGYIFLLFRCNRVFSSKTRTNERMNE